VITLLPAPLRVLGMIYTLAALVLGLGLIRASVLLIQQKDGAAARRMYKYSTAYLAFLFLAMIVDRLLL
jgi:protoheme IX farnesyltransferase